MTEITSRQIGRPEDKLSAKKSAHGFIFVIAMWLLSRLLIVVAMQLIAPLHFSEPSPLYEYYSPLPLDFVPGFVPTSGWELFSHWDGAWYRRIATLGYDYADDGKMHSIAFFPIFPLVIRGVMTLGLPFEVAATLVNNLAFLGALLLVYRWVEERHGISAARWATAVLAWCPYSLYGTVIYSEGLFLLLTTASLRAFDKRQHAWAALWGAMATATRVTGSALIPAFLFVAWRERRPAIAYAAGLVASAGLLVFIVYCAISFGDPLAFIHVQRAWRPSVGGFNLLSWLKVFVYGPFAWNYNPRGELDYAFIKAVMIFGGGYLLWRLRYKLSPVAVAYGFCSLALLLATGSVASIDRYAYGIVSLPLALGVLLAHHPRWGYGIMGYFAIVLASLAVRFARWLWVA